MLRLRTLLSIVGTQGARGMTIALCIGAFAAARRSLKARA